MMQASHAGVDVYSLSREEMEDALGFQIAMELHRDPKRRKAHQQADADRQQAELRARMRRLCGGGDGG